MNKTYIEYMQEISKDELYEGLLGYGLFPDKLPPIFTSKSFFAYCKDNEPSFEKTWHQFIYYEHMRNFNNPRALGIPNPFGYQRLCKTLAENWTQIVVHFGEKTQTDSFKTSRVHIRKMVDKPTLFEMKYKNWKIDGFPEPDLLIGKSWIARADISNCFPSMYSHSLPWALIGKEKAKQLKDSKDWFNKIDHSTQNIKNGETHGFIIGPHASNLLSEIILTTIDHELREKWDYTRSIDDYVCYVKSREDAEQFLSDLNKQLRTFDLMLNHKKTEICALPITSNGDWKRNITLMNLTREVGKEKKIMVDFNHTRLFFDTVLELMKNSEKNNELNAAILNYALQFLVQHDLTDNAKDYCIKTIMHYALIFPYLVPLLEEYLFSKLAVPEKDIEAYSNQIFDNSLKINHFEGLSYSIYFALKHNIILNNIDSQTIIDSKDCIVMLMAYLYFKKKNDATKIEDLKNEAKRLALNKDDFDQYWLFLYEILSISDLEEILTSNPSEGRNDWIPLKKKHISFLDLEEIPS